MKILEKSMLQEKKCLLFISDDSMRRFNVVEAPCDIDKVKKGEEIDWSKAYHFYYEKMVDENRAKKFYGCLKEGVFYINKEDFGKVAKDLGARPGDTEEIKKPEISEIWYLPKKGMIKIKKDKNNLLKLSLENPTQELKENIKNII